MEKKNITTGLIITIMALIGGILGGMISNTEPVNDVFETQAIALPRNISGVSEFGVGRNPNLQFFTAEVSDPTDASFISKFGKVRGVWITKISDGAATATINATANFSGSKVQLFDATGNYSFMILGDL